MQRHFEKRNARLKARQAEVQGLQGVDDDSP